MPRKLMPWPRHDATAVQPATWRAIVAGSRSSTLAWTSDSRGSPAHARSASGERSSALTGSPHSSSWPTSSRPVAPLAPTTSVVIADPLDMHGVIGNQGLYLAPSSRIQAK
ncbi:hypothetical protein WJ971_17775 [Achromobacter xylosoxidans]